MRRFLPRSGAFGIDKVHAQTDLKHRRDEIQRAADDGTLPEFIGRRLTWYLAGDQAEVDPP